MNWEFCSEIFLCLLYFVVMIYFLQHYKMSLKIYLLSVTLFATDLAVFKSCKDILIFLNTEVDFSHGEGS